MQAPSVQLNQLPVPQLEPVHQLGPYLSGLDVTEALEEFGKLADQILATGEPRQLGDGPGSFVSAPDRLHNHYQHHHQQQQHLVVHSPGGVSCTNGSQWLSSSCPTSCPPSCSSSAASSKANSPAPSDLYLAHSLGQHFHLQSPGSSSLSSSSSSSSASSPSSACSSPSRPTRELRRRKNATAAERYRRKLKGRKCGLAEELEREQQRNQRLRRDLEAKLGLYSEFVELLARQTNPDDLELAQLGSRSLGLVLADILGTQQRGPSLAGEQQRVRLQRCLQHFQSIVRPAQQVGLGQQATPPMLEVNCTGQQQQQQQWSASCGFHGCSRSEYLVH